MANFSFTIFGPEDGYKQFTVPSSGLIPDDSFKINPSDFEFKIGGRLLQLIKVGDNIYLSYHQQVFQVNGERPGYTFGESIYFEAVDLDVKLILRNIYELHAAFSHECLTEDGRFDGFKFVNRYRATQLASFNILKDELQTNLISKSNSSIGNYYSNPKSAYFVCDSLDEISQVFNIVSWMIESIGSMKYSRLFIIDNNSGFPSDDFVRIENLERENSSVFGSLYQAFNEIRNEKANLEKLKSELLIENSNLHNEKVELNSKLSNLLKSNRLASGQNSSKPVVVSPSPNLSYIEESLSQIKNDVVRLKDNVSILSKDFSKIGSDSSLSNKYSLIILTLFAIAILILGFLFYELKSLSGEVNNLNNDFISISSQQNNLIREIRSLAPKSSSSIEDVENNVHSALSRQQSKKK